MGAPIKTFACAFLGHWWELMGCAAFTFLGIYTAKSGRSSSWFVSASGVLAVSFFTVAAYRTWNSEYEAHLKAEAELNAKADMKGIILATKLRHNPFQDQTDGSGVRFKCQCTNHGQKPCEISKACLVLSGIDFKDDFHLEKRLTSAFVKTVGPGEQFACDETFKIRGVNPSQLDRSEVTIHLMDSLGTEYFNTDTRVIWKLQFDGL